MADAVESDLEKVVELAKAPLAPGTPVKIRAYTKTSTTGKPVTVRPASRGAPGLRVGTGAVSPTQTPTNAGRNPITPASATPPSVPAPLKTSAQVGALQQQAASQLLYQQQQQQYQQQQAAYQQQQNQYAQQAAARAAAYQKQQQQYAQQAVNAPKTGGYSSSAPKSPLGSFGKGLLSGGLLRGGGGGLGRGGGLRGRRGRLFPGSHQLAGLMNRRGSSPVGKADSAVKSDAKSDISRARDAKIPVSAKQLAAAHKGLEAAAKFRDAHLHGHHHAPFDFHAKLSNSGLNYEDPIVMTQDALKWYGFPVQITGQMNLETVVALESFLRSEGLEDPYE